MSAAKQTDDARSLDLRSVFARITLTGLVFVVCYQFVYIVPSNVLPALSVELGWILTATGGMVALGAGWLAWTMSYGAPAGLLARVLLGAATGGVVAFALSALAGPFIYITKPNHGVLVGVYLAAPIGALVGSVIGGIGWARRSRAVLSGLVLAVATAALLRGSVQIH